MTVTVTVTLLTMGRRGLAAAVTKVAGAAAGVVRPNRVSPARACLGRLGLALIVLVSVGAYRMPQGWGVSYASELQLIVRIRVGAHRQCQLIACIRVGGNSMRSSHYQFAGIRAYCATIRAYGATQASGLALIERIRVAAASGCSLSPVSCD